MTGTELDEILADDKPQEQEEVTTEGQTRDEQGRFASKAENPQTEQVETEEATETAAEHVEGIPPSAIAAARAKAREKENENEALRRELAELRGHVQALSSRPQQPQPVVQQEPEKEVNYWENPEDYLGQKLTPIQQKLQQQAERFSMRMAVKEHGEQAVQEAYAALGTAMQSGDPSAHAEFQRIRQSDDPYEDIVQWHTRQKTLKTVGNDPNAWLEAEMEKRLADPAYQAKVLERIQGAAAANVDRSNPVTKLPPSLNRLPSGGTHAAGSMSDEALFSHASR